MVAEAKASCESWTADGIRHGIRQFIEANALWVRLNDRRREVETRGAIGDAYIILGEYKAALENYLASLARAKSRGDRAIALNRLALIYIYLGDMSRAQRHCESGYKLSKEEKDVREEARALANKGEIDYSFGRYQDAIDSLERALTLLGKDNAPDRVRALLNLGYANFDLRVIEKARAHYQEALTESRAINDQRGQALALTALGGVSSYLGDKQAALDFQAQALSLFRRIGDRNGEGVALNGLGYVYRGLAEYQKSLDCYLEALQRFRELGNREAENFTITLVGKAYEGLGNNEKAREYFELAINQTPTYSQTRAGALNSIGFVLEQSGEWQNALAYYERAFRLYTTINDKMNQAATLNRIGAVYAKRGNSKSSLAHYRRALALSRQAQDPVGETSSLFNISKAMFAKQAYDDALTNVEKSLRIIESLRMKVASSLSRASYSSSIHHHYQLQIDILMQLQKIRPSEGFQFRAFNANEQARARSFLELLREARTNIREGVDPNLLEREIALERQLDAKAVEQLRLVGKEDSEEAKQIAADLNRLSAEYDELKTQIKIRSPRYAMLTQPRPLTASEIQHQVLDQDSIILEYVLTEERSYVWVVTRTEISSYELAPRVKIETAAGKFRELLTVNQPLPNESFQQQQERIRQADAQLPAAAAELGDLLIAPVQHRLGTKRLLIVPDGALHYIPFQALTVVSNAANQNERVPLLVKHEIVYEPSASALALVLDDATRRDAPNTIAVFANPVFEADDPRVTSGTNATSPSSQQVAVRGVFRDLGLSDNRIPALPASREEAEAILSVAPWGTGFKALGFEANRAAATQLELNQYRIVHFATHGFVDYEHPELSGLVLSLVDQNGQPRDGYLRLHDIYNLKLSANLVVLSACNTGLGKEMKGEGLIGLTRGFMYAGADSVVASLWKVDDDATAALMARFYEGMFVKGLPPADALREAQLWMSQQERWRAPYFWAAFIIQGRYDQVQNVGFSFPWAQRLVSFAGCASVLLLMACLFVGRRRSPVV
ncbi:MAG: CHAT domain-containing protein [Pyrinomonadaceae bacterium]